MTLLAQLRDYSTIREPANLFSARLIAATLIEVVEKSAPTAVKYISCEKREARDNARTISAFPLSSILGLEPYNWSLIYLNYFKVYYCFETADGIKSQKARTFDVRPSAKLITLQPRVRRYVTTSDPKCQMFAQAARSVFVNSGSYSYSALREIVISRVRGNYGTLCIYYRFYPKKLPGNSLAVTNDNE